MDFDIGNLFYVVITLVVVIVGLLGKKRKPSPKASEPGETGDQSQPGFLENLERVLRMDQEEGSVMDLRDHEPDLPVEEVEEVEEPEQSFQDQISEQAGSKPSFMSEYQQILDRLENREGDVFVTEGDNIGQPMELLQLDDEEGGTDYFEIIKDFDAGTAIVYSAIINRVDY